MSPPPNDNQFPSDIFNGLKQTGDGAPAGQGTGFFPDQIFQGVTVDPTQRAVNKILDNDVSPDKAAQAVKTGATLKIHPEVVNNDADYYNKQVEAINAANSIGSNDFVRNFANGEPLAAALAKEDWGTLKDAADQVVSGNFGDSWHARILHYMVSPATQAAQSVLYGVEAAKEAARSATEQDSLMGRSSVFPSTWFPKLVGKELAATAGFFSAPFAPGMEAVTDALEYLGLPRDQLNLMWLMIAHTPSVAAREVAMFEHPTPRVGEKLSGRDLMEHTAAYHGEFDLGTIKGWSPQELKDYLIRKSGMGTAAQKATEADVEVPKGMDEVHDSANVADTGRELASLDEAFKKVNEVKMKETSPGSVERFLDQHGLLRDKDIWIDAQAVKQFYGREVPREGDQKFGYIPGLAQRLEDAAMLGQEINIPRAQFLAHTDEATYGAVKPFLRLRDNGLNAHEASAWMEQHNPENQIAAETALAEQSQTEPVTEEVVPTAEELFAEGTQKAEERKAAAAEAEEPEVAALEPRIDPEVLPALDRHEAESNAVRGQYRPEEIGVENFEPIREDYKTKPGANVARLARLLGPKLYGEPTHMTSVSVKELLQNAFDAIKALLDKDPTYDGKIDIELNKHDRIVRMYDNGTGMTPEVLGKQFLEIAGTNKETESASGGLGIAKMLTTFANKGMYVMTYRDGVLSELITHGEELAAALTDPSLAPTIKTTKMASHNAFPEGHGTQVEITIPENYKDTSTGEIKRIDFDTYVGSHVVLRRSPLFGNIEVKYKSSLYGEETLPIGKTFPIHEYRPFFQAKFDWGDATIYMSNQEKEAHFDMNTHVLSNGLWQFSVGIKKDPLKPYGEDVPHEFYVDVRPRVRPEDPGYPIDLNRQGFVADAKKDFTKIFNYISQIWQNMDIAQSAVNYGNIEYLTPDVAGKVEVSPRAPLTPPIAKAAPQIAGLQAGDKIEVVKGQLVVRGKKVPELTPEKLRAGHIDIGELKVDPKLIKPDRVMLHDSVEIKAEPPEGKTILLDRPELYNWVGLVDAARQQFPEKFDKFMYEVGDVFRRMRDFVAASMGKEYDLLKKEGIGISFDPKYRGVSIRVPFSGSFVNPALTRYEDPEQAAAGVFGTMVHELAHHKVRNHDAEFPAEMQNIQIKLDIAEIMQRGLVPGKPGFSLIGAINALTKTYKENKDVFDWLRAKLDGPKSNIRHRGSRIKGTDEPRAEESVSRDIGGAAELRPQYEEVEGPDYGLGAIRNPGASGHGFIPGGTAAQLAAAMLHAEKKSLYLAPLFKDAKSAGMTDAMFKRYSTRLEEQDEGDYKKALAAAMKEVKRRLTPEYQKDFLTAAHEVETDLYSQPNIVVNRYFRLGELPTGEKMDPKPKLDSKAVAYMAPEGALKGLTKADGVHPDDIASTLGIQSGKELVDMLANFERDKGRKTTDAYLKQLVIDAANQKLNEKYGSIEERMAEEAQKIAHENHHFDTLDMENKQLAMMAGELPFTKDKLQEQAADIFNRIGAREATVKTYQRAMWKAAKEAEMALLKGDFREAFLAKQTQMRAFGALKEAEVFQREVKKGETMLDRVSSNQSLPSVDQKFLDQAHEILANLGRGRRWHNMRPGPLSDFVDENAGVSVANWLYDPASARADMTWKNQTVEERRDLYKSIQSLLHVGKEAKLLDSVHGKAELDNVVFDIGKQLERFPNLPLWEEASIPQRFAYGLRYVMSMNVLVERLLDYTDQFDPRGPLTTYLDRPLRAAYNEELKLREATVKKLKTLEKYTDSSINDLVDNQVIKYRGENRTLTRRNLRFLALHMGSKSGLEKAAKGFNVTEDDLWDLLAKNFTENDVKWLNGVWSLHQDLWERSDAMIRRVTGVEADPVEAVPKDIILKDGKAYRLNGGYSRIRYDRTRSTNPYDIQKKENGQLAKSGLFKDNYTQATTPQKYTIPRTGYFGALDLTGAMYVSDLSGQIHDIAFRESVLNARKLLQNGAFRQEFQAKWGVPYNRLLDSWLSDIANAQNHDNDLAQGIAHAMAVTREQVVSALTAGNVTTIFKHATAAAGMSVANVGAKGLAKEVYELGLRGIVGPLKELVEQESMAPDENFSAAFKQVTANTSSGQALREFILNSSPLMRSRVMPYWNTIRGAWERASFAQPTQSLRNAQEYMTAMSRIAMSIADFASAGAEWVRQYNDTFRLTGDHDTAVAAADRAVTRAHGSSFIGDKPKVLRPGASASNVEGQLWRSLTALMNFWLHNFNNNLQTGWDIGSAAAGREEPGAFFFKKPKGQFIDSRIPSISMRLLTGVVLVIAAEEMTSHWTRKSGQGFGEQLLLSTINMAGSYWPGVREATNWVTEGRDPSFGVIGSLGHFAHMAGVAVRNIAEGKAPPRNGLMYLIAFAGMMGAPFGSLQSGRTVQGLYGWTSGKEVPHGPGEAARQLIFGHPRPLEPVRTR